MLEANPNLTSSVIGGLGWYYLILFGMNLVWTVKSFRAGGHFGKHDLPNATPWAIYTSVLGLLSVFHFASIRGDAAAFPIILPEGFKLWFDWFLADPTRFFTLCVAMLVGIISLREWWTKPSVAWVLLNCSLLFMGLSLTDYDFRQIVGKPDNVPIVAMLFIVGFCTWIYFRRAVDNDRRIADGRPLFEQENNEKVLVWPDLVYTELICMIAITAILVFWGIALQAPLEEPASSVKTPNPSKAPWYFLGLQEMLVYFDPWLAGVVLPSIILVGLMAVPYIDFNKRGNGYYSFTERKFAITTFLFGFFPLWIGLIILGTFLRGPNWNFFGIYEYWDTHKLEVLNSRNLSELDWIYWPEAWRSIWGGGGLPVATADASSAEQIGMILWRERLGLLFTVGYFFVLPPVMAVTVFRKFFDRMGFIRFMVLANLFLWMALLPLKMVLRWFLNLKYIVAIPEWFFNI